MNRLVAALDHQFVRLHGESVQLVQTVSFDKFFQKSDVKNSAVLSCGEQLLRSAAVVEQTFGGISVNLWDDPFEWTQPESFTSQDKVLEYLDEVESTRRNCFELFKSDDDLMKDIVAPSGEIRLLALLLDALTRATHHLGRAEASAELQKQRSKI